VGMDCAAQARFGFERPGIGPGRFASRRRWHITPIERVRKLLVSAPGIAACDSCLARGCVISLEETRAATAVLLQTTGFQRHDRCWSCGRHVNALMYRANCVHCTLPIEPNADAVGFGTNFFHAACLTDVRWRSP
jgi:hypothetical protein